MKRYDIILIFVWEEACLIYSHDQMKEGEGFACNLSPRLYICLEGTRGDGRQKKGFLVFNIMAYLLVTSKKVVLD